MNNYGRTDTDDYNFHIKNPFFFYLSNDQIEEKNIANLQNGIDKVLTAILYLTCKMPCN